ncbi:MAG: deoxyribose-phosphate aldolase [Alphaproteobacteria bacterium]
MPQQNLSRIYSLVDLTTLNGDEQEADLSALAAKATFGTNKVAALCVYPKFVPVIRPFAPAGMPIAAVTNFPGGGNDMDQADAETREAIALGADEIDYVLPYKALMTGDVEMVVEALECQRIACGDTHLKVIIESGVLEDAGLIALASELSLDAGADFIKTSSGKVAVNATLEAADTMLSVIKAADKPAGFKAAGGIKTADEAQAYIDLAENIMGEGWVSPDTFRIGASSLIADLQTALSA